MLQSTARNLICVGRKTNLSETYANASGLLRMRIDHFLWVARHRNEFPNYQIEKLSIVPEGIVRPMLRPNESAYCFLAYLLTNEIVFAEQGKDRLQALADSIDLREKTDWVQMHNWCDAFPFARWLLLYDWIWDSPVFTPEEHARLEERYLYYLWAHPYQRLLARPLAGTPCNNQNGAMALACTVGGYLFGVKHGDSRRARQLLALGLQHLVKFVTSFPRGGYSFEGSVYMAGVNSFLIPFAIDLVETISGMDVLDMRENDQCASPREVLQAIMRLSTPDGLTLPWDCGGFARAEFTAAAAYLAYRTGDRGALDFLDSIGEMERPVHMGWGFDKTLWTLLWTLRINADARSAWTLNHAEPTLGAGAHGSQKRLFLYQMWDMSHWPPARAQFNPNAIIMTYDGSPMLLDGGCVEVAKANKFEHPNYRYFRSDIQNDANFGIGTVGAHNSIIFDEEEHFASKTSTQGKLEFSHYQSDATLLEGDVTDCYRTHYDVDLVRRASLVSGDDWVLIRDRIESRTAHKVTWRVHTRSGAALSDKSYFAVTTPEHRRLEICLPGSNIIESVHYPIAAALNSEKQHNESCKPRASSCGTVLAVNTLEGQCNEVSYHAHGKSLTLFTLLVPASGLKLWEKLDKDWQFLVAETTNQVCKALDLWPGGEPIDFSKASWFYSKEHHAPGTGLYRCEFDILESTPEKMWIELPRMVRGAMLRINGREFSITLGHEQPTLLPHLIQIDSALRQGMNIVEIVAPSTLECALCGEVRLLVTADELPPSRLVQRDSMTYEIHHRGVCDVVKWDEQECEIQRADGRVIHISIHEQPVNDFSHHDENGFISLQQSIDEFIRVEPQLWDRKAILDAIEGSDWRMTLDALEKIGHTKDASIIDAVWELLQREHRLHQTLPTRQADDINWYRLKAAAARVLGAAQFKPATELLGQMLLGADMYPSRVACAWALGQIATPQAMEYLNRVSSDDEWNTMTEAKCWATKK